MRLSEAGWCCVTAQLRSQLAHVDVTSVGVSMRAVHPHESVGSSARSGGTAIASLLWNSRRALQPLDLEAV